MGIIGKNFPDRSAATGECGIEAEHVKAWQAVDLLDD